MRRKKMSEDPVEIAIRRAISMRPRSHWARARAHTTVLSFPFPRPAGTTSFFSTHGDYRSKSSWICILYGRVRASEGRGEPLQRERQSMSRSACASAVCESARWVAANTNVNISSVADRLLELHSRSHLLLSQLVEPSFYLRPLFSPELPLYKSRVSSQSSLVFTINETRFSPNEKKKNIFITKICSFMKWFIIKV